ncbi:regulator of nonsense transcripts 1 [Nematocida displodere]|uniref:Regulator of nonsense transcripts 1 n=1 Tax=Nematocida displodere TaxID=1805483 RepID=A0A177ECQ9_9MICR|nr:regulator of nonsense transcripts 1 [Nematocida displodere]
MREAAETMAGTSKKKKAPRAEMICQKVTDFGGDQDLYLKTFRRLLTLEHQRVAKMVTNSTCTNVTVAWRLLGNTGAYEGAFCIPYVRDSQVYRKKASIALTHRLIPTDVFGSISDVVKTKKSILIRVAVNIHPEWTEHTTEFTLCKSDPMNLHAQQMSALLFVLNPKNPLKEAFLRGRTETMPPLNESEKYLVNCPIASIRSLNASQMEAVNHAVGHRVALVQGPPGTGKSTTCVFLIHKLLLLKRGPIILCAPTNVAVDLIAKELARTGINSIRLVSKMKEPLYTDVPFRVAHQEIREMLSTTQKGLLSKTRPSKKDKEKIKQFMALLTGKLLRTVDVICVTCAMAGKLTVPAKVVIMDEAAQATEPLVAMTMSQETKQLVLIGDHKQLDPFVHSNLASLYGLSVSAFERLSLTGLKPSVLLTQYRMHPLISQWPSEAFYGGMLLNGVTATSNQPRAWGKTPTPLMFYSIPGPETFTNPSYYNQEQIDAVLSLIKHMTSLGISGKSISVITPYEAQRAQIDDQIRNFCLGLEVTNIDAFQGRENDYIILTTVRSNDKGSIGFVNNEKRLNVAITRAKRSLIIVGNPRTLSSDESWMNLISHIAKQRLIFTGSVKNLSNNTSNLFPDTVPVSVPVYDTVPVPDPNPDPNAGPILSLAELQSVLAAIELEEQPELTQPNPE